MNIIKHAGTPQRAQLDDGRVVYRQDKLYFPPMRAMVPCTPYDDHFIYQSNKPGSSYLCTCGSAAVVAPPDHTGRFVCLFHATYGKHQTSVINKRDFRHDLGSGVRRVK